MWSSSDLSKESSTDLAKESSTDLAKESSTDLAKVFEKAIYVRKNTYIVVGCSNTGSNRRPSAHKTDALTN